MNNSKIFKKGWRFTVETSLIKHTKNYWYYDIKVAYMEYWKNFPVIESYEKMQDEREVDDWWFIKIPKKSWIEDKDWKQIYNHFANRFKEQEFEFIKF